LWFGVPFKKKTRKGEPRFNEEDGFVWKALKNIFRKEKATAVSYSRKRKRVTVIRNSLYPLCIKKRFY